VVEPELEGENITERIRVVLDTGATYTMIPWKIAGTLGLKPEVSERRMDITTASGVESVPLINLKSMMLFDKKVNDMDVVVHDLPPRSYVDGLLGLSFLRKFRVCLDFRKGVLEIE
jgi:aspartyl protease family protein